MSNAIKDFSSRTLKSLSRKGIRVINVTLAPDETGNFANPVTVYAIDDNGTQRMRTFREVLKLAE